MSVEFEFLNPEDKPALLALSTPEFIGAAQIVLGELGYKVHVANNHEDFLTRFAHVQYQVVIMEECFAAASITENTSLSTVQKMPMLHRRHSTIILLGNSFQSLNAMQAYQQSVHAVVHPSELASLNQIVQKVVADNTLFFHIYRDTQMNIARGSA